MYDCICKISAIHNGYEVEIDDPKKREANAKRDRDDPCCVPYEDPTTCFAFDDIDKVVDFLKTALPKAVPKKNSSTFDDAFSEAIKPDDDDNDEDD